LAYLCGKNHKILLQPLKIVNIAIFATFVIALIAFFWYKKGKSSERKVD